MILSEAARSAAARRSSAGADGSWASRNRSCGSAAAARSALGRSSSVRSSNCLKHTPRERRICAPDRAGGGSADPGQLKRHFPARPLWRRHNRRERGAPRFRGARRDLASIVFASRGEQRHRISAKRRARSRLEPEQDSLRTRPARSRASASGESPVALIAGGQGAGDQRGQNRRWRWQRGRAKQPLEFRRIDPAPQIVRQRAPAAASPLAGAQGLAKLELGGRSEVSGRSGAAVPGNGGSSVRSTSWPLGSVRVRPLEETAGAIASIGAGVEAVVSSTRPLTLRKALEIPWAPAGSIPRAHRGFPR